MNSMMLTMKIACDVEDSWSLQWLLRWIMEEWEGDHQWGATGDKL